MKGWVESGLRRLLEKKYHRKVSLVVGFGRLIVKTVDSYLKDYGLWMLKLEAVDVF